MTVHTIRARTLAALAVSVALPLGLLTPSAPAQAVPAPAHVAVAASVTPLAAKKFSLTKEQKARLTATWKKYKVSAATQKKLITKLESGKKWDALKNLKAKKTRSYTSGSYRVKVWTYADGSIRITQRQIPVKVNSLAVASCKAVSTHYSFTAEHCRVTDNLVLAGLGFTIDYGSTSDGDSTISGITRAYDGGGWFVLGDVSWDDPVRIEDNEFHMRQNYQIPSVLHFFSGTQFLVVTTTGYNTVTVKTVV